jgi:hypothetical protein
MLSGLKEHYFTTGSMFDTEEMGYYQQVVPKTLNATDAAGDIHDVTVLVVVDLATKAGIYLALAAMDYLV